MLEKGYTECDWDDRTQTLPTIGNRKINRVQLNSIRSARIDPGIGETQLAEDTPEPKEMTGI